MPISFFQDLAVASSAALSPELQLLQQAQAESLTIAPTIVTQTATFARLAQENHFFANESQQNDLSKKIARCQPPKPFVDELHLLYHQQLNAHFVRVRCWTHYGSTSWIHEIKGDTNLMESLIACWGQAVQLNVQHGLSPVEAVTNCQAVIQAQPAEPVACGTLFSQHPATGEHHLVVIKLWPGGPHAQLHLDQPTHYAVDIRTGMVVQHHVGSSIQKAKRAVDQAALTQQLETAEFHDEAEILELVKKMQRFKRHCPFHIQADFEIDKEELLITSVKRLEETGQAHTPTAHLTMRMMIATGEAHALDISAHTNTDGIGLLRSDYLFAQLETHPMALIKKGKTAYITKHLTRFLEEVTHTYPDKRIVYRLQNFTTSELSLFGNGAEQENVEPNPYLGWRGALRLMEQPELFEPELETFGKWLKRRHAPTGLIVPFVRSAAEWRWITNRWKERGFFDHAQFEHWFQITTPENVTNLETYLLPEVTGISLNLRTVMALMTGIDPDDPQLQASYPPSLELAQSVLKQVAATTRSVRTQRSNAKLQLQLHLEDYNNALVTSAVTLAYDGLTIAPASLAIARASALDAQNSALTTERF